MAEIKVGEYVRTELGIIYEYTEDEKNDWQIRDFRLCNDGEIVKHSKQLEDLIEVGDTVEIFDVLHENVIYIWSEEMLKALKEDIENGIQIRRILTKEQFSANCYKA